VVLAGCEYLFGATAARWTLWTSLMLDFRRACSVLVPWLNNLLPAVRLILKVALVLK
jgi:hypothetical protein